MKKHRKLLNFHPQKMQKLLWMTFKLLLHKCIAINVFVNCYKSINTLDPKFIAFNGPWYGRGYLMGVAWGKIILIQNKIEQHNVPPKLTEIRDYCKDCLKICQRKWWSCLYAVTNISCDLNKNTLCNYIAPNYNL